MKNLTIAILIVLMFVGLAAPASAQHGQASATTNKTSVKVVNEYIPQVHVFGTVSPMPNLTWEDQIKAFKDTKIEVFRKNADKTENLVGRTLDCRTQYGEGTPVGCVSEYGQFYFGSVLGANEYIVRVFMPGGYAERVVSPDGGQINIEVNLAEIGLKGSVKVLRASKSSVTVMYSVRNDSDWTYYVNIDAEMVTSATTSSEMVIPCTDRDCNIKGTQIEPGGDYSWLKKWDLARVPELNYIRKGASVQLRLRATHNYWRDLIYVDVADEFENPCGDYWQPTQK